MAGNRCIPNRPSRRPSGNRNGYPRRGRRGQSRRRGRRPEHGRSRRHPVRGRPPRPEPEPEPEPGAATAIEAAAAASIDAYGVGTKMGVSADAPYLDSAYKLAVYDGRPVMKLSAGKASPPGAKQVYRGPDGDVLALREEPPLPGHQPSSSRSCAMDGGLAPPSRWPPTAAVPRRPGLAAAGGADTARSGTGTGPDQRPPQGPSGPGNPRSQTAHWCSALSSGQLTVTLRGACSSDSVGQRHGPHWTPDVFWPVRPDCLDALPHHRRA